MVDSLGTGLAGLLEGTQPVGSRFESLGDSLFELVGDRLIEQVGHRLIELEGTLFELEGNPFEKLEGILFGEFVDNPDLGCHDRLVDTLAVLGDIPDC